MRIIYCLALITLWLSPLNSQTQDTTHVEKLVVDIGGAIRYNYNLSSWKKNQVKRGGDLGFEVFRINVDAKYRNWQLKLDQRFYASGFGGTFLKYGWMQYNINEQSHVKFGLIPSYFGTQQFNSHSWFFQLPFYLGFEDDHDMGISYSKETKSHQIDIGFYKNSEELTFADNGSISDSRYSYDFSGPNKEINQLNLRYNYKVGTTLKHKIGTSLQYGGIWNIDTKEMGSHKAIGIHYELDYGAFNLKTQILSYDNQANNGDTENTNSIQMTAYGAPYNTASKASIYSIGLAYTIKVDWGVFTSIQIYNDYSYMNKSVSTWEDTQMNVLGLLISADPVYIYVDYASGLHQPWLGPQWTNALSTGDTSNSWESRFNVNVGFYF